MSSKKILIICGTGVATSTLVKQKVADFVESKGLTAEITQGKVADVLSGTGNADFIISTTEIPASVKIPVIAGLPFLTGIGIDAIYQQIEEYLNN